MWGHKCGQTPVLSEVHAVHSLLVESSRTASTSSTATPAMALVVICGQPCSGKSTIAEKLADRFRSFDMAVAIVDEPSLHMLARNESYKNAVQEKHTRGKLKSAVDRALSSKNTVVIFDSLNNIKVHS